MSWGVSATASTNPISLLLAAPPDRAGPLVAAFSADPRFRVLATATSAPDARYKLALHPDALLVLAEVFPDFDALATALSGYEGAVFVLLPADTPPSVTAAVSELPPVQQVLTGEVNLPELAGRIYETLSAQQRLHRVSAASNLLQQNGHRAAMVGWRCIAVWSLQGGVGKSTLSASLALEAAERRLPTLLTGLGAPDVLPLRLGFKRPEPNLLDWLANPTPEGLRLAVRQYDVLDVLAGFPDQAALDRYLPDAMSPATGLPALANTAAHAGYAVVVLDVSSPELAAPAIAAANTLLIVAPATPDGLLAAREATRLAHQALAGRHAVPLSGIHLVLNRVRDSQLGPEEVMRSLAQMLDAPPPLAAVIPDDPRVDVARVQFRPAYAFSEPLRQAARTLGDLLFAPLPAASTATRPAKPARVWRIGPFRIRR